MLNQTTAPNTEITSAQKTISPTSSLRVVPVPLNDDVLGKTAKIWVPFLERISEDSKEPLADLISQVTSHLVRLVLVFNDDGRAIALGGVRLWQRGPDLVGDLVWTSGIEDRKNWQHLIAEVEALLKQAGCSTCRPICRYGWTKFLKQQGYKLTHCMMEKEL